MAYEPMIQGGIPRIDLDLRAHKKSIAIQWSILLLTSSLLPIILYFPLRYAAHLKLSTTLAITSATFGAFSVFALTQRTWRLMRAKSTCRPLGASRGSLDFFQWNFISGFVVLTIVISVGNVIVSVPIVALGTPVLLGYVSLLLIIAAAMHALRMPLPVRISSTPRGEVTRSGVYAIAEDIVAVDGGRGIAYREQLQARYLASPAFRTLCFRLDLLWGFSGVAIAAVLIGLLFGLDNPDIGFTLAWTVPFAYAGVMTIVTIYMVKAMKKVEQNSMGGKMEA